MRLDLIRAVQAAELAALTDLWVAAWVDAMPEIDFDARRPWFERRVAERIGPGGVLIVARDDESATARGLALVDSAERDLDQVAVHPDHKGRGIASALIEAAKPLSPESLKLSVNQANTRAIRLYQRHGFKIVEASTSSLSGLPIWRMRWES